jgi:transposase
MPKRRYLQLSTEQTEELEAVRDTHAKPHMREKAAVLLKIAEGMSPYQAAQSGGLKPHQPNTIYQWLDWYEAEGTAALEVQPGRGRKPAFSPCTGDGRGGQ